MQFNNEFMTYIFANFCHEFLYCRIDDASSLGVEQPDIHYAVSDV